MTLHHPFLASLRARLLLTAAATTVACGEVRNTDAERSSDDRPDAECSPGELNMKRCDLELCLGLNETAVSRCGNEGQFGACQCVTPGDGCAALDCAPGYACHAGRCLETARCNERACEDGFACWDGSVCGQVLAGGDGAPVSLALGSDALYVALRGDDGASSSIERIELATGDTAVLASEASPVAGLVVDDARAYWSSEAGVSTIALAGGTATTLLPDVVAIEALAVHQGALYAFDWHESRARLMRVAIEGGMEPQRLLSQPTAAVALAVHREQLYWSNEAREVWRAELDGSNATRLESGARAPLQLAVSAEGVHALWTQTEPEGRVGTSIYRHGSSEDAPLGDYDARHAVERVPMSIAVEGDTVFWLFRVVESRAADRGDEGYAVLQRTDRRTGEARYVWGTERLDEDARIAVDGSFIYVANARGREILRIVNRW